MSFSEQLRVPTIFFARVFDVLLRKQTRERSSPNWFPPLQDTFRCVWWIVILVTQCSRSALHWMFQEKIVSCIKIPSNTGHIFVQLFSLAMLRCRLHLFLESLSPRRARFFIFRNTRRRHLLST